MKGCVLNLSKSDSSPGGRSPVCACPWRPAPCTDPPAWSPSCSSPAPASQSLPYPVKHFFLQYYNIQKIIFNKILLVFGAACLDVQVLSGQSFNLTAREKMFFFLITWGKKAYSSIAICPKISSTSVTKFHSYFFTFFGIGSGQKSTKSSSF
jgi:hypothetical protein